MKKKTLRILGALLAFLLLAVLISGIFFRRITVVSGGEFVDSCPRFARPGRQVTVTTAVVSDGEIFVSGADGEYVRPGVYVFTMPDADVRLRVYVSVFPDGA